MPKTSAIHGRIYLDLENKAEEVFHKLGLLATQAITLFYKQVQMRKGLPLGGIIPNKTSRRTFEDTDAGRNLTVCQDADDMFDKLGV